LIEAQMAGCPIVTVPVGGVRELVDDGETGLVTEQVDATELAERVVGLLRDPKLRARLGERARRRAVRFTSRAAAGTYAARLAEIAGV
jgi:phosphatidylinositol alpha-1,6-mannosyltransferase